MVGGLGAEKLKPAREVCKYVRGGERGDCLKEVRDWVKGDERKAARKQRETQTPWLSMTLFLRGNWKTDEFNSCKIPNSDTSWTSKHDRLDGLNHSNSTSMKKCGTKISDGPMRKYLHAACLFSSAEQGYLCLCWDPPCYNCMRQVFPGQSSSSWDA